MLSLFKTNGPQIRATTLRAATLRATSNATLRAVVTRPALPLPIHLTARVLSTNTVRYAKSTSKPRRRSASGTFSSTPPDDPYLLSARISRLVERDKLNDAVILVQTARIGAQSEVVWNHLIAECARAGRANYAFRMFTEMKRRGFKPTDRTFTHLLNALAVNPSSPDTLARATDIYTSLRSSTSPPSLFHTNTVLKAFSRAGGFSQALRVFDAMPRSGDARPDKITYTTMLNACAYKGGEVGFAEALRIWEETIDTVRKEHLGSNLGRKAMAVDLRVDRWRPAKSDPNTPPPREPLVIDEYLVNAMLFVCKSARNPAEVEVGFDIVSAVYDLHPSTLPPPTTLIGKFTLPHPSPPMSSRTLDVIISLCFRSRRHSLGAQYFDLALSHYPRFVPDIKLFNSLISIQSIAGQHERAARTLFTARARGLRPDVHTYEAALRACLEGAKKTVDKRAVWGWTEAVLVDLGQERARQANPKDYEMNVEAMMDVMECAGETAGAGIEIDRRILKRALGFVEEHEWGRQVMTWKKMKATEEGRRDEVFEKECKERLVASVVKAYKVALRELGGESEDKKMLEAGLNEAEEIAMKFKSTRLRMQKAQEEGKESGKKAMTMATSNPRNRENEYRREGRDGRDKHRREGEEYHERGAAFAEQGGREGYRNEGRENREQRFAYRNRGGMDSYRKEGENREQRPAYTDPDRTEGDRREDGESQVQRPAHINRDVREGTREGRGGFNDHGGERPGRQEGEVERYSNRERDHGEDRVRRDTNGEREQEAGFGDHRSERRGRYGGEAENRYGRGEGEMRRFNRWSRDSDDGYHKATADNREQGGGPSEGQERRGRDESRPSRPIRTYSSVRQFSTIAFRLRTQDRFYSTTPRNRLSKMFIPTSKENPLSSNVNTVASHQLMLRAGFIRQSASGIYSLLPFALRTLEKLERIIEEEMRAIDAQKLSLPILLSSEAWKQTGRWESSGGELFRLKDRKFSDFLLAPTHEEEITQLVANEVTSYRQLPLRLYQIGRKYRDEMRPRSGLLRGREFIMKDLYTFDATEDEAASTYEDVRKAYSRIFKRIGVPFAVADADTGNIGGTKSHEYHFISQVGEDSLLVCPECSYTANEERAWGTIPPHPHQSGSVSDPNITLLSQLIRSHSLPTDALTIQFATVNYVVKDSSEAKPTPDLVAVVLEKGRMVNLLKLRDTMKKQLGEQAKGGIDVNLVTPEQVLEATRKEGTLWTGLSVCVDESVNSITTDPSSVPSASAPQPTMLSTIIDQLNHSTIPSFYHGDFHNTQPGDICPQCPTPLTLHRAIEVGHTFLLGIKYSAALGALYHPVDAAAGPLPIQMGCFGLGVSRMLAAVVESSHDDRGIIWPVSVAPFRVAVVPADDRGGKINEVALRVYDALDGAGSERGEKFLHDNVVIDDRRGTSFGFRMKDAELVGYPYVVVVGNRAVKEGIVELQERRSGKNVKQDIKVEDVGNFVEDMARTWFEQNR